MLSTILRFADHGYLAEVDVSEAQQEMAASRGLPDEVVKGMEVFVYMGDLWI